MNKLNHVEAGSFNIFILKRKQITLTASLPLIQINTRTISSNRVFSLWPFNYLNGNIIILKEGREQKSKFNAPVGNQKFDQAKSKASVSKRITALQSRLIVTKCFVFQ
jgi:hypothetical protein